MVKEKKTYRLSKEALLIIENRDRAKYPTANEFIERKILESVREDSSVGIMKKIHELEQKVDRILEWTKDYSLPNL